MFANIFRIGQQSTRGDHKDATQKDGKSIFVPLSRLQPKPSLLCDRKPFNEPWRYMTPPIYNDKSMYNPLLSRETSDKCLKFMLIGLFGTVVTIGIVKIYNSFE